MPKERRFKADWEHLADVRNTGVRLGRYCVDGIARTIYKDKRGKRRLFYVQRIPGEYQKVYVNSGKLRKLPCKRRR